MSDAELSRPAGDASPGGDAEPKVASPVVQAAREGSSAVEPLDVLRWLAILGVVALVLGRFLGPALPGSGVGVAKVVRAFELAGALVSQLFAVGTILGAVFALVQTSNTTIPPWVRIVAVAVGVHAALVVLGGAATNDRGPETSALLASLLSGSFAILAAVASSGARVARLPAVALGLVGAAAAVRSVGGLTVVYGGKLLAPSSLTTFARVAATVALVLVGLALALAVVHVGRSAAPAPSSEERASRPSLWSPVTLFALVLAVVAARQAMVGTMSDAGPVSVLLKRAADRFLVLPEPYVRAPVRLFLGFLTPLVAIALLTVRRVPTLGAALCLAIVAADVTSAPIGAMTLLLASLGVLLVARSGHVLWSALIARPPPSPSRG